MYIYTQIYIIIYNIYYIYNIYNIYTITNIDKNDLCIINYCRKSLLFSDNKTWKKKSTDSCFNVTMGSFDGAEICELVGLYI